MDTGTSKRVAQPLFQSVGDDGTLWLFVCFSGDGWAITRNGERIESGTSNGRSLQSGVETFVSLTRRGADAVRLRHREVVTAKLGVNVARARERSLV
jgi:hypothetical protein